MACAIPSFAEAWRPELFSPCATLYYLMFILAPVTV